ncbi:MAG: hypothetical protein V4662_07020 [Verrucomicrobiota bacterium]
MRKRSLYLVSLGCLVGSLAKAQLGVSPSQTSVLLRELREKAGALQQADSLGEKRALLEETRSLTYPQFLSSSLAGASRLQADLTAYSSQYQEGRAFLLPWSGTLLAPGTPKSEKDTFLGVAVDQVFEWNQMRSGFGHQETFFSTTSLSVAARHGTLETGRLCLDFAGGMTQAADDDFLFAYAGGQRALFIHPGSSLSYDVQFGSVTVMLYDRVSARPEALVGGPGRFISQATSPFFGAIQNDLGAAVSWQIRPDLSALVNYNWASSDATHSSFRGSREGLEIFADKDVRSLLASLTWDACQAARVGIQSSYAWSTFAEEFSADGEEWHAGLFAEINLPWAHRLRVEGGMQGMEFERQGQAVVVVFPVGGVPTANEIRSNNGDNADLSPAPYYKLALSGRLSEKVVHELSLGREATLALLSNHVESCFANYGVQAGLWKGANLGLSGFYEMAEDSGGAFAAEALSYGGVARLAQTLGRLTLSFGYGYTWFEADAQPQAAAASSPTFEQQSACASASYQLCAKASINLRWQRFETQWKAMDSATQDRLMLGMRFVF